MFSNHNSMNLEVNNRKNQEIHKYAEIKQHTIEKPMDQRRNHRETRRYLSVNETQRTKAMLRGSFIAVDASTKKEERSQITGCI